MNLTGIFIVGIMLIAYAVYRKDKKSNNSSFDLFIKIFMLFLLYCWTVEFIGMRTTYNDTSVYIYEFQSSKGIVNMAKIFGEPYGGHVFLIDAIKNRTNNYHIYLVIVAAITFGSYLFFFRRHSDNYALTMLCFIVFGWLLTSMAALKQMVAIAFSLLAIDGLIRKKYLPFVFWIIAGYTFHPYVVVLFIISLFTDKVWSKKVVILVFATFIFCIAFSTIMGAILTAASSIGKEYSVEEFTDHTINPLRVIVDSAPVVISFIYRDRINKKGNRAMILGVNMTIISWLLTAACLVGNPIYLYRTAMYFSSILCVVFPWMLKTCLPDSRYKNIIIFAIFALYTAVFVISFPGGFNFFGDFAKHAPLSELFK